MTDLHDLPEKWITDADEHVANNDCMTSRAMRTQAKMHANDLKEALSSAEPVAWGVFGKLLDTESAVTPQYICETKEDAHFYINDCLDEMPGKERIEEAKNWTVKPLFTHPASERECVWTDQGKVGWRKVGDEWEWKNLWVWKTGCGFICTGQELEDNIFCQHCGGKIKWSDQHDN